MINYICKQMFTVTYDEVDPWIIGSIIFEVLRMHCVICGKKNTGQYISRSEVIPERDLKPAVL